MQKYCMQLLLIVVKVFQVSHLANIYVITTRNDYFYKVRPCQNMMLCHTNKK